MKARVYCILVIISLLLTGIGAQGSFWFDHIVLPHIKEGEPLQKKRTVHPGAIHYTEFEPNQPYLVNLIEVDLSRNTLTLEAEKWEDHLFNGAKTSTIAESENRPGHIVVAAVNSDFWRGNYIPVGPFVDDGMVYKLHYKTPTRAAFILDDRDTPYIFRAHIHVTLVVDDATTCAIDIVNIDGESSEILPEEKDMYLYTDVYGDSTGTKADGRTEVVLEMLSPTFIPNQPCNVKVVEVHNNAGDTPIEDVHMVLSGTGAAREFIESYLTPGKELTIHARVPGVERPIVLMVGGLPLLIQDGQVNIDNKKEGIRESFVTDKHPRTAIGYSKDKKTIFLFTIDGRQPGLSTGADLTRVAEFLKQHGAWQAMNLDGGGSTTMWVRGELVNSPSDRTGERTVTNSLLLVSNTTPGKPEQVEVFPEKLHVAAGGTVKMTVHAFDAYHNPIAIEPDDIALNVEQGPGTIKEGNIFVAGAEPGEGMLTISLVSHPGISKDVPITVRNPARIVTDPETILLRSGDSCELDITVLDDEGAELQFRPGDISIQIPSCAARGEQPFRIKGLQKGKGKVSLTLGNKTPNIPLYVDIFKETMLYDFDDVPESEEVNASPLTGVRFDTDKTKITVVEDERKQGDGACRLDYSMLHGGVTAIYIPINATIQTAPHEITLWVYGDGKNGWLRAQVVDKDGEQFLMDFTSGASGISWTGWKMLGIDRSSIFPKWNNPDAFLDFPAVLEKIYLAQSREHHKADGTIILDALTAVYPPEQ